MADFEQTVYPEAAQGPTITYLWKEKTLTVDFRNASDNMRQESVHRSLDLFMGWIESGVNGSSAENWKAMMESTNGRS